MEVVSADRPERRASTDDPAVVSLSPHRLRLEKRRCRHVPAHLFRDLLVALTFLFPTEILKSENVYSILKKLSSVLYLWIFELSIVLVELL